jgi:hypothetical protein
MNITVRIGAIESRAMAALLEECRRRHRGCRDYRVYESVKRDISQLAKGDWNLYENSIGILADILEI